MKVAVVFTQKTGINMKVTDKHLDMVRSAVPGAEVSFAEDPGELINQGFDADILICWSTSGGHCIVEPYCNYAKNLKWIHAMSAGVEGITQSSIANIPGLRLTNAKGIHGIPISENVVSYIVAHYRGLRRILENQQKHKWQRFVPEEAYGKTVAILGIGAIGKEIAKRCKAFEMYVIGVKRTMSEVPYCDEVLTADMMDEALSRADVVVMVMPFTGETYKILDGEKLSKMKKGAIFVNVGRGQTVDTDALVSALQSGQLAGAMLDAMDPEPLNDDSPLWNMDNVLISPHMSAETPLYMDRAFEVFQKRAAEFLAGKPMKDEINLKTGY